jgi:V/A-type H+-transporting ATPase subunit E
VALDDLLATLDARASEERAAVLAEAREEAESIRARSARECEALRRQHLARIREDEERSGSKAVAEARTEARRRVLDARRRVADRVREALTRRVAHCGTNPHYRAAVVGELAESVERAGATGPSVRLAPDLAPHLDEWIRAAEKAGVTVTIDADLSSGFVLTADEGLVTIDGTLESRLELAWRGLAAAALREAESTRDPGPAGGPEPAGEPGQVREAES